MTSLAESAHAAGPQPAVVTVRLTRDAAAALRTAATQSYRIWETHAELRAAAGDPYAQQRLERLGAGIEALTQALTHEPVEPAPTRAAATNFDIPGGLR
jgi:hypothetical protein